MFATPVKSAYVPCAVNQMGNSISSEIWLTFSYSNEDKTPPYRWPKILKYQNKFFQWMSYNSDSMRINYKEISKNDIAVKI